MRRAKESFESAKPHGLSDPRLPPSHCRYAAGGHRQTPARTHQRKVLPWRRTTVEPQDRTRRIDLNIEAQ